jgi:hypothetical protein
MDEYQKSIGEYYYTKITKEKEDKEEEKQKKK